MKKFIRFLLKIPATPIVLLFHGGMVLLSYPIMFFEWVYDKSDWDKEITRDIQYESIKTLKRWFTSV